jgi:peptidoglycan hydrolase CwlO-like protein
MLCLFDWLVIPVFRSFFAVGTVNNENMKHKNLLLKVVLICSISFNIYQFTKIRKSDSQTDYYESENSDMEDSISELEIQLEECKSENDDFENEGNDQSSRYNHIQNEKFNLESKIQDLENQLNDCKNR